MEIIIKDLFYEIISYLKIKEVIKVCLINQKFNRLCNEGNVWKMLFNRDYPNFTMSKEIKETGINFKEEYTKLFNKNTRLMPIYINTKEYKYRNVLWIDDLDNYKIIMNKLKYLLNSLTFTNLIVEFENNRTLMLFPQFKYHTFILCEPQFPIQSIYIYTREKYQYEMTRRRLKYKLNNCKYKINIDSTVLDGILLYLY